jgi:hypothetical protein
MTNARSNILAVGAVGWRRRRSACELVPKFDKLAIFWKAKVTWPCASRPGMSTQRACSDLDSESAVPIEWCTSVRSPLKTCTQFCETYFQVPDDRSCPGRPDDSDRREMHFRISLFVFSHLFLFSQAWAPGNIHGYVSNLGSLSRLRSPLPASCSSQWLVLRRSEIQRGKSRFYCTIESSPADHTSALFSAILDSNATLVEVLLQQGANPTSFDDWDVSCLQLAVKNGEEEIVRSLVRAGVDVNMSDRDGETTTPLHVAAQRGHLGIVQLLVENGAGRNSSSAIIRAPHLLTIFFFGFHIQMSIAKMLLGLLW